MIIITKKREKEIIDSLAQLQFLIENDLNIKSKDYSDYCQLIIDIAADLNSLKSLGKFLDTLEELRRNSRCR